LKFHIQVALFVLRMHQQAKLGNENITDAMLKTRCELFYFGLTLAGEISFLLKTTVNLYAKFGKMLSKPLASVVYKFVENLKIIKETYVEKSQFISDSIGFVFQYLQFRALDLIGMCKKKVMVAVKKERKFDLSTTLVLIEKLLYGTVSVETLASINLALSLTEAFKNFGNECAARLVKLLDHMTTLCHLEEVIKKVCDPSFLFWHQNLIAAYFKSSQECHLDQHKLELMLKTADECTAEYYNHNDIDSVNNFNPFILHEFKSSVLTKVCNSIEINLRLDFHSNLQKEKFNPLEIGDKLLMEDNRSLLTMKPAICNNEYVLIRNHVESYLSKMFYNLTTISLKDWRTYEEMRRLAEKKYSLETISDHLPTQTLDHGIDVLQIMKNIHLFVSTYNYNLNNQIFVESTSHQINSQHYNTIRINNIAQSLVTRGNGVINTITNYVYQFLRKKLFVLSKVVYDERIKSRLTREIKLFRENLNKGNEVYGFDRAHILNRDVKKLETFEDGKTLLDKICGLITQIGNLLGFMRMIKSGISHVNSNSISFMPTHHLAAADEDDDDDNNELEFLSMCKEQKLSVETITAAKCFQDDIEKSTKGITEGSPHLKVKHLIFLMMKLIEKKIFFSHSLISFCFQH
jgi:WASH complex subunit 7